VQPLLVIDFLDEMLDGRARLIQLACRREEFRECCPLRQLVKFLDDMGVSMDTCHLAARGPSAILQIGSSSGPRIRARRGEKGVEDR